MKSFAFTHVWYIRLTAQPSAPTPLLQASGMCIKPQRGNCRPPDGTILVLTQTKPCNQPFMQFTLSADGTLKHHCSGKMVCPRKPARGKRCELMISSKCQPQDAKFERTAGMICILTFAPNLDLNSLCLNLNLRYARTIFCKL